MTRTDFNTLVKELSRKMYRFAFRILSNQEEAEDAVQEVFIRLWKMGDKLDAYNSVEALATTMTKNYCIDQVRKRRRMEEYSREDQANLISVSPAEQIENLESVEIINKIVDKLPESYKQVIQLREIEGFSYEEIAEKTGQNLNALRVSLSRARKLVKEEYNKYQYERKAIKQFTRKVL